MKRRTFITLLAAGSVAACARPNHATIRGLTMGTSYAVGGRFGRGRGRGPAEDRDNRQATQPDADGSPDRADRRGSANLHECRRCDGVLLDGSF